MASSETIVLLGLVIRTPAVKLLRLLGKQQEVCDLGLTFKLRHYNSKLSYNYFNELLDNGRLNKLDDYSGLDSEGNSAYNINYNAFTIDLFFRWVFLPGSEINLVWKNSIFMVFIHFILLI